MSICAGKSCTAEEMLTIIPRPLCVCEWGAWCKGEEEGKEGGKGGGKRRERDKGREKHKEASDEREKGEE